MTGNSRVDIVLTADRSWRSREVQPGPTREMSSPPTTPPQRGRPAPVRRRRARVNFGCGRRAGRQCRRDLVVADDPGDLLGKVGPPLDVRALARHRHQQLLVACLDAEVERASAPASPSRGRSRSRAAAPISSSWTEDRARARPGRGRRPRCPDGGVPPAISASRATVRRDARSARSGSTPRS